MKYFHGFSLQNEAILFESFITDEETLVCGFSFGAQEAFEYVYTSKKRINKLILLSPAFFQSQKPSYLRTQLRYFSSDKDAYIKQFLKNVTSPSSLSLDKYLNLGTKEDLTALLYYVWDANKIQTVLDRGTSIEVFLGKEDKILNVSDVLSFFKDKCTVYVLKKSGHLLKECVND